LLYCFWKTLNVQKFTNEFFTCILQIIGILGIVFGVLILNSFGTIKVDGQVGFPPQALIPIVLITICSIVVFISFLGCCGAIRESVCMTMSYAVCLLVLLILQLTIIVLLFTNKVKINMAVGEVIDKAWESRESRAGGVFDAIQTTVRMSLTYLFATVNHWICIYFS